MVALITTFVAAVVATIFLFVDHFSSTSAQPGPPQTTASSSSSAPPAAQTTTPQDPVAVPPTSTFTPATPVMSGFIVASGYSNEAVPCCMVGPNMFQLGDNGKTEFGYHWSARLSDGTENDSQTCAILVTVTGPENPPSLRTNYCTTRRSNTFSGFGNYASVSTPGQYTITVIDQVSGATGSVVVTVVQ